MHSINYAQILSSRTNRFITCVPTERTVFADVSTTRMAINSNAQCNRIILNT